MKQLHVQKEAFLKHLEGMRGYSLLSVRSYEESIHQMLLYAQIEELEEGFEIDLMPWRLHIASLRPKTIARKLSSIRSFIKFLRHSGVKVELRGDESIKVPKALPKPVSDEHMRKALSLAPPLEKLAILLLYTLGLRISELTSLRFGDVSEAWCRVLGKGSKERDIPMIPEVYQVLKGYDSLGDPHRFIFEIDGVKLSENSLRYKVTKTFEAVGFHVTPHQLRHAYATELLNHNARIADVSELLGHASMATTQIYTKLGSAVKMENYLKSHPLCQNNEEA